MCVCYRPVAVHGDVWPRAALPSGSVHRPPRAARRRLPTVTQASREGGLPGPRGLPQAQRWDTDDLQLCVCVPV